MTDKQKFELVMRKLEAGGWDFLGLKVKNKGYFSWSIDISLRLKVLYSLDGVSPSSAFFDLATVLGQLSTRKILFGEEMVENTGYNKDEFCSLYKYYKRGEREWNNLGADETMPSFQYHSTQMILSGNPKDWLNYVVDYLEGKK